MSPRSILKRSSQDGTHPSFNCALPYPPEQPQVHFPPTPSLTQTYPTHSGAQYDRAPIVVLPNDCALPERGCPGRTYDGYEARCKTSKSKSGASSSGKSIHPRAVQDSHAAWGMAAGPSSSAMPAYGPPPLIPDVSSSESDESDGIVSPPPELSGAVPSVSMLPYPYGPFAMSTQEQFKNAHTFLPRASSAPSISPMSSHSSRCSKKSDKEQTCNATGCLNGQNRVRITYFEE